MCCPACRLLLNPGPLIMITGLNGWVCIRSGSGSVLQENSGLPFRASCEFSSYLSRTRAYAYRYQCVPLNGTPSDLFKAPHVHAVKELPNLSRAASFALSSRTPTLQARTAPLARVSVPQSRSAGGPDHRIPASGSMMR